MNYCTEEQGMNQPLNIQPNQFTTTPPLSPSQPPSSINPTTSNTPGMNFPTTPTPQITITFNQPTTTLTVVYIPTNRPNQPTNVKEFNVTFSYPNGQTTNFTSIIPSTSTTTTSTTTQAAAGIPSVTTTTTTTPSTTAVILPSNDSPQVDLPPNFQVPQGTIMIITITVTTSQLPATGVCNINFFSSIFS
jgi:hypothetical protein